MIHDYTWYKNWYDNLTDTTENSILTDKEKTELLGLIGFKVIMLYNVCVIYDGQRDKFRCENDKYVWVSSIKEAKGFNNIDAVIDDLFEPYITDYFKEDY